MKEKILEVVDLCKEYPVKRGALLPKEIGRVHAVNHVSFTLYQGETLGIIGESGCGKTTLIRMLMGLEEATGGYVQFGDKKIHRHMPPLVRKKYTDGISGSLCISGSPHEHSANSGRAVTDP